MKEGPDISLPAAMMGDPARANMLMALMSGMHLTASELANEAGVTPATASVHLAKLASSGLITATKQGRHKYFRIADADVAHAIEALIIVSSRAGHMRTKPGPKNDAMRVARSCYDHLAGKAAVKVFEAWVQNGVLVWDREVIALTEDGRSFFRTRGLKVDQLEKGKRPLCRSCIDWSERRHHLGGAIGAAVLTHALNAEWVTRDGTSRTLSFKADGEQSLMDWSQPEKSLDL
jgi:DNA-binding transcriptional ArsR family regulator